jgi:hypothetical protein
MCAVTVQQRVNNEQQTRLPVFRLEKDPRVQGVEKIPPFLYMGFISTKSPFLHRFHFVNGFIYYTIYNFILTSIQSKPIKIRRILQRLLCVAPWFMMTSTTVFIVVYIFLIFATAKPPTMVGSIWIIRHFTAHTCIAVSDPLLAVQNYSM